MVEIVYIIILRLIRFLSLLTFLAKFLHLLILLSERSEYASRNHHSDQYKEKYEYNAQHLCQFCLKESKFFVYDKCQWLLTFDSISIVCCEDKFVCSTLKIGILNLHLVCSREGSLLTLKSLKIVIYIYICSVNITEDRKFYGYSVRILWNIYLSIKVRYRIILSINLNRCHPYFRCHRVHIL